MKLNECLCHIAKEADSYLNRGEVKHMRSFLEAFNSVWETMTEEERKSFTDSQPKVYGRIQELNKKMRGEETTALDMFQS